MSVIEAEIVQSIPAALALPDRLTIKQRLFIQYYIQHRNGVKAAELAGYGGSYSVLNDIARDNLQKPVIREAIDSYFRSRIMSPDNVLAELSDIGNAELTKDSVVRPQDKIKSLELMGKYHKLLTDRVETETNLSDNDVHRIGESLMSSLMEAAQRRRLQSTSTATDAPPEST